MTKAARKKTTRSRRVRIEGDMTIYRAQELKEQLMVALEGCRDLEIDLERVSELDSAGVQLLVLVTREARSAGKTVHLAAPSAAVREAIELLGLTQALGAGTDTPSLDGSSR